MISLLSDKLEPLVCLLFKPTDHDDDNANFHLLHTLTHLDTGKSNYVKIWFADYSSAFNTIIPTTLTTKLEHLELNPSHWQWISNFLTRRPQTVKMCRHDHW